MSTVNPTNSSILSLYQNRWSPKSYNADRELSDAEIAQLLEAARWAPSAFNEQPWRYLYAARQDPGFQRLLDCLVPANAAWAADTSLLIAAFCTPEFKRNGRENRHARYDTGQASFALVTQATEMGLHARQMAGFDPERASALTEENWEPVAFMAVGEAKGEAPAERQRMPLVDLAVRL